MSDKQIATHPSKFGYAQVKLGTAGAMSVTGGEDTPIADPSGRPGWYYSKPLADPPTVGKVNYFFGVPTSESLPFSHYSCMWAILSIDHYEGTHAGLPWMSLYTKYDASRSGNASWYRTKVNHLIPDRATVRPGERICIYTGDHAPPAEQLNGARLIHLDSVRDGPNILGTDDVQYLVLQTDSTTPQSEFCVETLAYMTRSTTQDPTQYNLHLLA